MHPRCLNGAQRVPDNAHRGAYGPAPPQKATKGGARERGEGVIKGVWSGNKRNKSTPQAKEERGQE